MQRPVAETRACGVLGTGGSAARGMACVCLLPSVSSAAAFSWYGPVPLHRRCHGTEYLERKEPQHTQVGGVRQLPCLWLCRKRA